MGKLLNVISKSPRMSAVALWIAIKFSEPEDRAAILARLAAIERRLDLRDNKKG